MPDTPRIIHLGDARVTIVNVGDSLWRLADTLDVPVSVWRPTYADIFEQPLPFPSQCVHIALPGASVLVDAGRYSFPPDSPQRPPDYAPPPDLAGQLIQVGVRPADVTHLVITHLHADHFDDVTVGEGETYARRFPNARCYIGRAGWEDAEVQRALEDPGSLEARTIGALRREGGVELVEGDRDLAPGIRLIAAAGETPGHQIVRVESGGRVLYCLGDLYHHPVEVERPDWMAEWCDPPAMRASRQALVAAALAEDALLVAAHVRGAGRLRRTAAGATWESV
jgi:glyoxylase-like metal-dependent hydrolase (beta-lactamase superfamily II)